MSDNTFIVKVRIKGAGSFRLGRKLFDKKLEKGVEAGLIRGARVLKERSNEIAPIEKGRLIEESFVSANPQDGMKTVAYTNYGPEGSKSADYAVIQHEGFKQKKVEGRQWRYLETPVKSEKVRKEIGNAIEQEVNKAIAL